MKRPITHGLDTGARAFLGRFDPRYRGTLGDWFHRAVRNGIRQPHEILKQVQGKARTWIDTERPEGQQQAAHQMLEALERDPDGALRFAAYVLHYEALLPTERQEIQADRQRIRDLEPPTAEQLALIRSFGRVRAPQNVGQARRIIERHQQRGTRQGVR